MSLPQPGLFAQGTRSHRHLEFDLRDTASPASVLVALQPLRQPSVAAGGVNIVIGFGPELWKRLTPDETLAGLTTPAVPGLPSTPHDIWIWIHGTGDVALIGTNNPGTGGTFAFVQRWVHDLTSFERLSVTEQELVIGRTKPDSVELDDDTKPDSAHIARVVIEDDSGGELEIYRRSVPYGTALEHGLMFVAFTNDMSRIIRMLERMFGLTTDGLHDRLTEFSEPVIGATYFVPSIETLGNALG